MLIPAAQVIRRVGVPLTTVLPGSPNDGDVVAFTDSVTAPSYVWLLSYAAQASTYRWYFIGGSPAIQSVATAEQTSSGSYTDLATVGPDFTTPLAGDYDVTVIGQSYNTTGDAGSFMSYAVGGTAASDEWALVIYTATTAALGGSGQRTARHTGLSASTLLRGKYRRGSGGNANWAQRRLSVVPFRVG